MRTKTLALSLAATLTLGCTGADPVTDNPFLQNLENDGKEDSAYLNPDGFEVEIDLEGDIQGPAYRLPDGPAIIGQYALTYFRKREIMYIESLAEDGSAEDRTEWLVNGTWYTTDKVPAGAQMTHWRLRGLNSVLLFAAARDAAVGKVFTAKVPLKPFSLLTDAAKTCADDDEHITLDSSVYWYRWEPEQASCKAPLQDLKVTVSKTFARSRASVYPEFDKLVADKKLTAVVMFGQIDDGAITERDTGMVSFRRYARWLADAGYRSVTAPVGKRYEKVVKGITVQIDLYSPRDFSGLGDEANFANFQRALSEHEVIAWDGHSMLGASDFWGRPTYPNSYQIFLYGGCLGFEYYVRPILAGKGGNWKNLDLVTSVIEVTATGTEFAAPAIAKLVWAIENNYRASWRDILLTIRRNVGDSTFGVSGVRDNCYTPNGTRCR